MAIVYPELEHFNSHADAITRGHDGKNYFVEPWLEKMTMGELLLRLENGEYHCSPRLSLFAEIAERQPLQ